MPGEAGKAHSNPESRFLGLRVRIPPGAMDVSVCVVQ